GGAVGVDGCFLGLCLGRGARVCRAAPWRRGARPPGPRAPAAGDLPRSTLAVQHAAVLALVHAAAGRAAAGPVRAEHRAGPAGLAGRPDPATAAGRPAQRADRHASRVPADIAAGQPDLPGGHYSVLLAVLRHAARHAPDCAAAEPRWGGGHLVADPADARGRGVAAC